MAISKEEQERLDDTKVELYLLKRSLLAFKGRASLSKFEQDITNALIGLVEDKEFDLSACGVGYL